MRAAAPSLGGSARQIRRRVCPILLLRASVSPWPIFFRRSPYMLRDDRLQIVRGHHEGGDRTGPTAVRRPPAQVWPADVYRAAVGRLPGPARAPEEEGSPPKWLVAGQRPPRVAVASRQATPSDAKSAKNRQGRRRCFSLPFLALLATLASWRNTAVPTRQSAGLAERQDELPRRRGGPERSRRVIDGSDLRAAVGLPSAPDHNTLCRTFTRLVKSKSVNRALDLQVAQAPIRLRSGGGDGQQHGQAEPEFGPAGPPAAPAVNGDASPVRRSQHHGLGRNRVLRKSRNGPFGVPSGGQEWPGGRPGDSGPAAGRERPTPGTPPS